MPVLANPRHERFAQERAQGKSADEAYVLAGYSKHRGNAARMSANEGIRRRVDEIVSQAAEKVGITVERLLTEYACLATADITDAVEWSEAREGFRTDEETGEETPYWVQGVTIKASRDLPKHVTAAIAEISQTQHGIKIKFHNKIAALDSLARIMGQFRDRLDVTGSLTLEQLVMQSFEEEAKLKAIEDKSE